MHYVDFWKEILIRRVNSSWTDLFPAEETNSLIPFHFVWTYLADPATFIAPNGVLGPYFLVYSVMAKQILRLYHYIIKRLNFLLLCFSAVSYHQTTEQLIASGCDTPQFMLRTPPWIV